MKKIYMCTSADGETPFWTFFNRLDKKTQRKVGDGLKCMALFPDFMKEPHIISNSILLTSEFLQKP